MLVRCPVGRSCEKGERGRADSLRPLATFLLLAFCAGCVSTARLSNLDTGAILHAAIEKFGTGQGKIVATTEDGKPGKVSRTGFALRSESYTESPSSAGFLVSRLWRDPDPVPALAWHGNRVRLYRNTSILHARAMCLQPHRESSPAANRSPR